MPQGWDDFYGWKDGPPLPHPQDIWQTTILTNILDYEGELHDELGEFTLAPSTEKGYEYEVILTCEQGRFRLYMSDHHPDARLIIDDYIPEEHGGIPID